MNKVLKHLKNNAPIYLIILVCVVVLLIVVFHKSEPDKGTVDKSLFTVVNLDGAIRLFNDDETKFLLVSNYDCERTINYVPTLQFAMLDSGFQIYYLELSEIDEKKDAEKLQKLGELLNLEITYENRTKPIIEFFGETPMNIIIRKKKVVYAYIGDMNGTTLKSLAQAYGLGEKNG